MTAVNHFKRSFMGSYFVAIVFAYLGLYKLAAFGSSEAGVFFRIALMSMAVGTLMLIMYLVKKRQADKFTVM